MTTLMAMVMIMDTVMTRSKTPSKAIVTTNMTKKPAGIAT